MQYAKDELLADRDRDRDDGECHHTLPTHKLTVNQPTTQPIMPTTLQTTTDIAITPPIKTSDILSSHILGHRGAKGERQENSHAGFEYAQALIAHGLAGVEFDVQMTADRQLIVFHDDTINRMYHQQGWVEQLAYDFFVDRHATTSPPLLLKHMLPLLSGYRHIELEIKTHARTDHHTLVSVIADTFTEIATDYRLPLTQLSSKDLSFTKGRINSPSYMGSLGYLADMPITFTSFDTKLLSLLQQHPQLKQVPRGLLIAENMTKQDIVYTARRLQCTQVGILANRISQSLNNRKEQTDELGRRLGYHRLSNKVFDTLKINVT